MTIRAATLEDIPVLSDIHASAFAHAWRSDAIGALMLGSGAFAFVAEDAEACGFILVRLAADECELLTIAVRPERRKQGLASGLLDRSAQQAWERGAMRMFLEVGAQNLAARNLYAKFGFREAGRRKVYYENGDDALVLSARLPLIVGKS